MQCFKSKIFTIVFHLLDLGILFLKLVAVSSASSRSSVSSSVQIGISVFSYTRIMNLVAAIGYMVVACIAVLPFFSYSSSALARVVP